MQIPLLTILKVLCLLVATTATAQPGDKGNKNQPDPPESLNIPPAPVLTPEQALETFQLVEGFNIEVIAAEPLIHDPVATRIDQDGRIWVVEMQSFMPDVDGKNEDAPTSRIVILTDTDNDGRMDQSKVFIDQLVLPRALQFVKGGILYADQLKLYFVPVGENDTPGDQVVIDEDYSKGGNVEHKANGLLRGIDNWYYSAKSSSRYRQIDGKWVEQKTEERGQWGISQDDYGRLYYNGNSSNVYGDWVPPGSMHRNPNIEKKRWQGSNIPIVKDSRVYPIRITTGVNRGYQKGTLNEDFKLNKLTAACGPQIYRGTDFPAEFYGNAFTPAPCCHLIKRNIITEDGPRTTGTQAYKDSEFLASTDERFRPVAIENAPDGSMHVVDFYRGIIQHKTYVTTYLRRQIIKRELATPTGLGRIYRISSKTSAAKKQPHPQMSAESPADWVAHLRNPNAWWRETAQRLLVDHGDTTVIPALTKLAGENTNPLAQIHALWTLEGLGTVPLSAIQAAATSENPNVLATVVRTAKFSDSNPFPTIIEIANKSKDPITELQLILSLGQMPGPEPLRLLANLLERHANDELFTDAALSSLYGRESEFLKLIQSSELLNADDLQETIAHLENAIAPKTASSDDASPALQALSRKDRKRHATGKVLYDQYCFACHGQNGEGLTPLAPPIAESEWVTGPPIRLAAIVLNGIEGPIHVGGELYDSSNIQPLMPGLKDNPEYDDEKLAAILTYIRNAFGNQAPAVQAKLIKKARKKFADQDLFTEESLKEIQ